MEDRSTPETQRAPGEPPRRDISGTALVLGIVIGTLVGAGVGWAFGQTGAGIAGGTFGGALVGLLAAWWSGRRDRRSRPLRGYRRRDRW